jgi:hypothetical protein
MIHLYKNKYTFDGGFSNYPYLNTKEVALHINPNIWNQNEKNRYNLFTPLSVFNAKSNVDFSLGNRIELGDLNLKSCNKDAFDIEKLFEKGYEDTRIYGKETLDAKLKD